MADLQSMTLTERMNTINGDGVQAYTFQEACNKWLSDNSPINGTAYSANYNKYTPEEAFAIIRHKIDLRSETLDELVSELGSYYPIHKYTATEALNKKNAVLVPYSLNFDGNDYVTLSAINTTGNHTISFWFKSTDISEEKSILSMSDSDLQDGFVIVHADQLMVSSKSATAAGNQKEKSTLLDNTWYHIVVVKTAALITNIYVNGVDDTNSSSDNWTHYDETIIGGRSGNGSFIGKIDEVSIFNKVLTQEEVTSLYAADPQNAGDAVGLTNLVGYWKFDEGTGEPQDTSGNGNHGAITGATWTVH